MEIRRYTLRYKAGVLQELILIRPFGKKAYEEWVDVPEIEKVKGYK